MTSPEGVIKYKYTLKPSKLEMAEILPIEKWRAILYRLHLVGEYLNEKVGYGNLSHRPDEKSSSFLITGSQTGHLPHLRSEHYCRVVSCNLQKMTLQAEGQIPPSSESITHFALYQANPKLKFIFHVHSKPLWQRLIDEKADSIEDGIEYGTLEMAQATSALVQDKDHGILVMKGHEDGIIAYGIDAQETGQELLKLYRQVFSSN
jgi:hypothetical protein